MITAFRGGMPDRVPFTCYGGMAPTGMAMERLRDLGLVILERMPPFEVTHPYVELETSEVAGQAYPTTLTIWRTPVGQLTQVQVVEPGYGSFWTREFPVKRPEDYAVLEFIIRDEMHEPRMERFLEFDRSLGDHGIAIPRAADPPLQELWRRFTGFERFALDWQDCRSEVLRVLDAMSQRNRRIWDIVANTPGEFCASGGNISGDLIGPPCSRS